MRYRLLLAQLMKQAVACHMPKVMDSVVKTFVPGAEKLVEVRCKHCGVIVVGIHESICRMRDEDEPITRGSYR